MKSALSWLLMGAVACGGTINDGQPQETKDGGVITDAGTQSLCPESGAACSQSSDCKKSSEAPTNCSACLPYNSAVCARGECRSPEVLGAGDPVNFVFQVEGLTERLVSLAGVAITAESSGGKIWTCDDVYKGRIDLKNSCHNVLDTRGLEIVREDNQYTVTFSRFAGGQLTLFAVYGFAESEARGQPIGVTCGTQMMRGPGGGL